MASKSGHESSRRGRRPWPIGIRNALTPTSAMRSSMRASRAREVARYPSRETGNFLSRSRAVITCAPLDDTTRTGSGDRRALDPPKPWRTGSGALLDPRSHCDSVVKFAGQGRVCHHAIEPSSPVTRVPSHPNLRRADRTDRPHGREGQRRCAARDGSADVVRHFALMSCSSATGLDASPLEFAEGGTKNCVCRISLSRPIQARARLSPCHRQPLKS